MTCHYPLRKQTSQYIFSPGLNYRVINNLIYEIPKIMGYMYIRRLTGIYLYLRIETCMFMHANIYETAQLQIFIEI
jgi:hypothetical protein